jgi:hypothetical protein
MRAIAATFLVLAGCAEELPAPSWGPLQSTLEKATQVEAFRIGRPDGKEPPYPDWPVVSGPVALDASMSRELVTLLLDPKSFSDNPKPCEPLPGVKVRWRLDSREVQVVFCFECSTLWYYSSEKRRDQREFDPVEKKLVSFMKKAFPKDPEIQALK